MDGKVPLCRKFSILGMGEGETFAFIHPAQFSRSKLRYWIASATYSGRIFSLAAKPGRIDHHNGDA